MKKLFLISATVILLLTNSTFAQYGVEFDTVQAQKYDMGKMWTFENPPVEYLQNTYGFNLTDEWLEKIQKAALKFGGGCSASFLSEDALIMTNHHCVRGILPNIDKEGENVLRDGFYAETLSEERQIPNLKVEQLIVIEDVTEEIQSAMNKVATDADKIEARDNQIELIKQNYASDFPDLTFRITSLYNGGKYSLYGYKIYDDIRLVFVPELFVAKLGGDYDNFTYPRYGLDCAFLRAYENGKPAKTDFYFKWNMDGIVEDQLVFVVGNPGRTDRINTVAQIEFARDIQYPMLVPMFKDMYAIYEELVNESEAKDFKLIARLYSIGNALKVYEGTYKGLLDPFLMARKKDFEKKFKEKVKSDKKLNEMYGNIWDELQKSREAARLDAKKIYAYQISNFYSPEYLKIAKSLVQLLEQMQAVAKTDEEYKAEVEKLFPDNFNKELQDKLLKVQLNIWKNNLDENNEIVKNLIGSKSIDEAAEMILKKSNLTTKEDLVKFAQNTAQDIFNSDDPFIYFVINTQDDLQKMIEESRERRDEEEIANQMLGEALFKVFGDAIPPDATGTLRIADGIVKGYDYNGTRAPYKTTFYGSLDRFYSFDKKFPFNLPANWESLPEEFDLKTPINFASTNDIVGGNSGSPVINAEAEIVGLAFDGNIESLPNNFIYTTEANRTVSVSALGMIEAIKDLYNADRLAKEILNSKME